MDDAPRPGRLLAATPALSDTNFAGSVVLILEHGDDGTLGVVLNRPSAVPVGAALPDWAAVAAQPEVIFVGGPVQTNDALLGLGQGAAPPEGGEILPGIGLVDLEGEPHAAAVRLFTGYAGWGVGQLEREIATGGWFVVDGETADVFGDDPDRLWLDVLRRQGGVFKTVAEDPSLN